MNGESLARASTWMDEIKSDRSFRYMSPWHYVNMPEEGSYATIEKPEEGEIVGKINQFIEELKAGGLSQEEQVVRIRCLVHLVGDVHQPMHVGRSEDLGGNRVTVLWFRDTTNLHRLWDSDMIDFQNLSYTELSDFINHPTAAQIAEWQSTSAETWAMESHAIAQKLYAEVEEYENYSYRYSYENFPIAEQRMLQAGIRLAGILNSIYE